MDVLSLNLPPCYHISVPHIMVFDNKVSHQRIHTTHSHASHCHHCNNCNCCNVDFVLFHNVTWYTNSILSCIHVNTTNILNVTYTLVAPCMTIGRWECNYRYVILDFDLLYLIDIPYNLFLILCTCSKWYSTMPLSQV